MFVGNLTPVLIITGACAATHDADVFAAIQVSLLQNAMLIAGVVTLVQLFSIGPIGGKVPIIMGTSSGFIGVFQSIAHYAVLQAFLGGVPIDEAHIEPLLETSCISAYHASGIY